jgi:hypothetical protein
MSLRSKVYWCADISKVQFMLSYKHCKVIPKNGNNTNNSVFHNAWFIGYFEKKVLNKRMRHVNGRTSY